MNLRNVLRAFTLLRQLTDDESALLVTLRGMSEGERELLVESLNPEKPTKPATAKTFERCARCGNTKRHSFHKDSSSDHYHEFQVPVAVAKKSQRASSLARQIKSAGLPKGDGKKEPACSTCDFDSDHNIHHLATTEGYHNFQPASQAATTAMTVGG